MNAWNRHLGQYLELRHRLGFKLRDASSELRKFVCFAQRQKASFLTTKLALGGPPKRPAVSLPTGPLGWAWCATLPSTSVPWTHGPKSLRKACCPTATIAKPLLL